MPDNTSIVKAAIHYNNIENYEKESIGLRCFLFHTIGKELVTVSAKKKAFWIITLILAAAVLIVLCVTFITGSKIPEYDGTLVRLDLPGYM